MKEKQEKNKNLLVEAYKDFDLVSCYGDGISALAYIIPTKKKKLYF